MDIVPRPIPIVLVHHRLSIPLITTTTTTMTIMMMMMMMIMMNYKKN
jgi:hypothetical protein